jgi:hypothetical protein
VIVKPIQLDYARVIIRHTTGRPYLTMSKNRLSRTPLFKALCLGACSLAKSLRAEDSAGVYMADGIKIGEVSTTSAVVGTCRCQCPENTGNLRMSE